jgi:hypothetical protein
MKKILLLSFVLMFTLGMSAQDDYSYINKTQVDKSKPCMLSVDSTSTLTINGPLAELRSDKAIDINKAVLMQSSSTTGTRGSATSYTNTSIILHYYIYKDKELLIDKDLYACQLCDNNYGVKFFYKGMNCSVSNWNFNKMLKKGDVLVFDIPTSDGIKKLIFKIDHNLVK